MSTTAKAEELGAAEAADLVEQAASRGRVEACNVALQELLDARGYRLAGRIVKEEVADGLFADRVEIVILPIPKESVD